MDNHTFRSRLTELMQKSRKALRLYSSMGRINGTESSELSDLQVHQWRETNSDLLKQISIAIANPNVRQLAADICAIRDRFHTEWRGQEADLHLRQKALISASENGDFIKAATLSRELIVCKARLQASQAAYQEIDDLLRHSKVISPTIELTHDREIVEPPAPRPQARVIPLRKQS